jgi:hypothetical protein
MNKPVLDIVTEAPTKRMKLSIADFIETMTGEDEIGRWAMELAKDLYNDGDVRDDVVAQHIGEAMELMDGNDFSDLVADIRAWCERATLAQIKTEVATLLGGFPGKEDLAAFAVLLVRYIQEKKPSRLELALAIRELHHTSKFRPSIAEVLQALKNQKRCRLSFAIMIPQIPYFIAQLQRQRPSLLIEHRETVPFDDDAVKERQPVKGGV